MFIIKTIIYILIFSTCTYIGIIKSSKYSKRVDELKTFKDALNMFKMKIKFTDWGKIILQITYSIEGFT